MLVFPKVAFRDGGNHLRACVGLVVAAISLAGCGPASQPASPFSGEAAKLDAYLVSDKSHQEMLDQMCSADKDCSDLPHIYRVIKETHPVEYAAFVNDADNMVKRGVTPTDVSFQFALSVLNTANVDLEDEAVLEVVRDTAASIQAIKAVYPPMCVSLLIGRNEAPPADVARKLFDPQRYKLNVSMLQKASANRSRIERGELKLEIFDVERVQELSAAYFQQLGPEEAEALQRFGAGMAETSEYPVACDVMEGLMLYIADRPTEQAGSYMRGLAKAAQPAS